MNTPIRSYRLTDAEHEAVKDFIRRMRTDQVDGPVAQKNESLIKPRKRLTPEQKKEVSDLVRGIRKPLLKPSAKTL